MMYTAVLGLAVALAGSTEWRTETTPYGLRRIAVDGEALGPRHTTSPARFTLQCHPGEGGAFSLFFAVRDSRAIAEFDFDAFEGPDSTLQSQRLMTVRIEGPAGTTVHETVQSGYFDHEMAFVFERSARIEQDSPPKAIAAAARAGIDRIEVMVRSGDGAHRLDGRFEPRDTAAAAETLSPCLEPLAPIP